MTEYQYGKPIDFDDWLIDLPDEFSFWIENKINGLEWWQTLLIAAGIIGILWLMVALYLRRVKSNVRKTSDILAAMLDINRNYNFIDVDAEIVLEYPQKSEKEFEKVSLDRLFMSTVQKKIPEFEEVFGWANTNAVLAATYREDLKSLPDWTEKDDDCGRRCPFWLYTHYEHRLVDDAICVAPVTQPVFTVIKRYEPRKGKAMEERRTYTMADAKEFVRLAIEHKEEIRKKKEAQRKIIEVSL